MSADNERDDDFLGLNEEITRRYFTGATLVGVDATKPFASSTPTGGGVALSATPP
jgi:hypothetical protein